MKGCQISPSDKASSLPVPLGQAPSLPHYRNKFCSSNVLYYRVASANQKVLNLPHRRQGFQPLSGCCYQLPTINCQLPYIISPISAISLFAILSAVVAKLL